VSGKCFLITNEGKTNKSFNIKERGKKLKIEIGF